jgi:hypothetical protein
MKEARKDAGEDEKVRRERDFIFATEDAPSSCKIIPLCTNHRKVPTNPERGAERHRFVAFPARLQGYFSNQDRTCSDGPDH